MHKFHKITMAPCCTFMASHARQSRQEYARGSAAAPLICRPADIIWQGDRELMGAFAFAPYCPVD
jgi:hypothetical protein